MKTPLVSIILSTYNGSQYIKESINSVVTQTYQNFEFIIINDYSTDTVEKIILDFQEKDSRIIYIKNSSNLKLTTSLNKGLKIAKGKYIARIDDDDIWIPSKLEKQVFFMEKNTKCGLCGTSTIIINTSGEEIDRVQMRESNTDIKNNFLQSNQFTHSSIIMRKNILQKAGGYYNTLWNGAEDYELWLRIGTLSTLHNLGEYLLKYRWKEDSISRKNQAKQQRISIKLCLKYREKYNHFIHAFFYRNMFYLSILLLGERSIKNVLWNIKKTKKQGRN